MEIINAATEKLRRIGRRAKGRYRRALNVSEATQPDSALLPEAEYAGRRASELPRLDELEEEMAGEDRPLIPWQTCPKSAPAILAQPRPLTELRPEDENGMRMPGRSLCQSYLSRSYLGLPEQYARKEAVADRIKSLGRILRRSNSLSESTPATLTTSGVPSPPSDSSSRRRLARHQDIHSDSFLASPLYATASEGSSLSSSPDLSRGVFEPLVKSGVMVAAAELDRLSLAANAKDAEAKPPELNGTPANSQASSAQTHDVPPNSPASLPVSLSGAASPALFMSSGLAPMTPIVPNNTPASVSATPVVPLAGSHSSKYSARRKAARASRLSEVQTAGASGIPEEPDLASESIGATDASTTTGQTSGDWTPLSNDSGQSGYRAGDDAPSLQSRPLTASPKLSRRHGQRLRHTVTAPAGGISINQKVPLKDVDMTQLTEMIDKAIVKAIAQQRLTFTKTSANPSGPGATHPCFDIVTLRSNVASQLKLAHHDSRDSIRPSPTGLAIRPLINGRASSPGPPRESAAARLSALLSATTPSPKPASRGYIAENLASAPRSETHAIPCKDDTWDPASGDELGDSDPFCPADDDDSEHKEQQGRRVDELRADRRRRNTSETVYMAKRSDATESGSVNSEEVDVEKSGPRRGTSES